MQPQLGRYAGVDTVRVVAIIAVICIHTRPFDSAFLTQLCRFAVPFFFIATGFFFRKNVEHGRLPLELFKSYLVRLGFVFVAWSAIYVLVPTPLEINDYGWLKTAYWKLHSAYKLAKNHPLTFGFQGTSSHFWFITALLFGLGMLAAMHRLNQRYFLFPLASILFAVGLLGGAYSILPIGYHTGGFNMRNGPFLSLLCIVLGWRFAQFPYTPSVKTASGVVLLGFGLMQIELAYLTSFGVPPESAQVVIGDVVYGAGVFLLATTQPHFGRSTPLPWMGQRTLGVYLSHFLFINSFGPLRPPANPTYEIALPVIVYSLSLALTRLMEKSRYTARLLH